MIYYIKKIKKLQTLQSDDLQKNNLLNFVTFVTLLLYYTHTFLNDDVICLTTTAAPFLIDSAISSAAINYRFGYVHVFLTISL